MRDIYHVKYRRGHVAFFIRVLLDGVAIQQSFNTFRSETRVWHDVCSVVVLLNALLNAVFILLNDSIASCCLLFCGPGSTGRHDSAIFFRSVLTLSNAIAVATRVVSLWATACHLSDDSLSALVQPLRPLIPYLLQWPMATKLRR